MGKETEYVSFACKCYSVISHTQQFFPHVFPHRAKELNDVILRFTSDKVVIDRLNSNILLEELFNKDNEYYVRVECLKIKIMGRKTTSEMVMIARTGASLSIDASEKTTSEIITIAQAMRSKCFLIVRNANVKTTSELNLIAQSTSNILLEL